MYYLYVYQCTVFDLVRRQQHFVWPENRYIGQSPRLRATDPFEGQTKLLLSERQSKTVLLYTSIFQNFLIHSFYPHIIRCFQYPRPSSPRIWTTPRHCDINITWLKCWPVNRTVLQRTIIFFVNSQNVVFLLYLFYKGEKMMVYNNVLWLATPFTVCILYMYVPLCVIYM